MIKFRTKISIHIWTVRDTIETMSRCKIYVTMPLVSNTVKRISKTILNMAKMYHDSKKIRE